MLNEENVGRQVGQLSRQIRRRMDARLASMGITGVQSRTLHYIISRCQDGPVFQKDLEEAFQLRRSTATGILQLMEKNGLIRREAVASDARLKSLVPTPKAEELQEEICACIRETEGILIQDIEPADLEIFLQVIKRMADNLDG